jgi:hypothetical protein
MKQLGDTNVKTWIYVRSVAFDTTWHHVQGGVRMNLRGIVRRLVISEDYGVI